MRSLPAADRTTLRTTLRAYLDTHSGDHAGLACSAMPDLPSASTRAPIIPDAAPVT